MRLGVDTGGTFTDLVGDDGRVVKVPSTPDDPSRAVVEACAGVRPDVLAHGTTVATNALLERRLGRVALVTTRGFADVLEIARQARPSLYDARVDRPAPLIPRALRFEVAGRLDARGRELEPFDGVVPELGSVDAVAVCLLHADLDPRHEREVAAVLRGRGIVEIVCSHEVSPEFREYERMVTTAVDAALRTVCAPYLRSLASVADDVLVMTSAGGLVPLPDAVEHPARLLVSGPAAGVRAAAALAAACGRPDAVAFDMGGTSTDVVSRPRRRARAGRHPSGRGAPRAPARARDPHHRRGRRLDRAARRRWCAGGRSGERGRRSGPGGVRPGRDGGDGHRRRSRARSHPGHVAGLRAARRRRGAGRARTRRRDRGRCDRGGRRGDGARGAGGDGRAGRRSA